MRKKKKTIQEPFWIQWFAFVVCVCLLSVAPHVDAAVDADLITSLPGFGSNFRSRQYSGFLPADSQKTVFLHYWLVLSESNPATDPLVVWLNGGPGCSSLEGLLYEQGPLHFTGGTDGTTPTLYNNPYAWNKKANMLFIESPAGVGFSYTANGSLSTSDEITSQNNYGFLKSFMAAYPEYSKNKLFITGESYAGIFIPTFVDRIRVGQDSGDNSFNLVGFAIGNGCWGNKDGSCGLYSGNDIGLGYKAMHLGLLGQISPVHFAEIQTVCGNLSRNILPADCISTINQRLEDAGDFNIYNVYDQCQSNAVSLSPLAQLSRDQASARSLSVGVVDNCSAVDQGSTWLSLPSVQSALHVTAANRRRWAVCSSLPYVKTRDTVIDLYPGLLQRYTALIFSGDTDNCVPYCGTEEWVRNLGYPVKEAWRPWLLDQQVAGYVVSYQQNITFLTVKGAGHMVPQYAPQQALSMFTSFITGAPY